VNNPLNRGKIFEEYENLPYTIRLKVPTQGETTVTDEVFGKVVYNNAQIDDQILMKSDGFPTYHLANVVDDHLMKITHVIRGEEWLPSTPKHIILYNAFEWTPPAFVHLPLLLNANRSKLSKRNSSVSIDSYIEEGYLPSAVVNFVALLGWSPSDNKELFFTMQELYRSFSLSRLNSSAAIVDGKKKMIYFNKQHMQYLLKTSAPTLVALFKKEIELLGRKDPDLVLVNNKDDYIRQVLEYISDNFSTVKQNVEEFYYYFYSPSFKNNEKYAIQFYEVPVLKPYLESYNSGVNVDFFHEVTKLASNYNLEKLQAINAKYFPSKVVNNFCFPVIRYYLTGKNEGEELEKLMKTIPISFIKERLKFGNKDFNRDDKFIYIEEKQQSSKKSGKLQNEQTS